MPTRPRHRRRLRTSGLLRPRPAAAFGRDPDGGSLPLAPYDEGCQSLRTGGVPMGGVLPARGEASAPRFALSALADPDVCPPGQGGCQAGLTNSAYLQRTQVIKGRVDSEGEMHETPFAPGERASAPYTLNPSSTVAASGVGRSDVDGIDGAGLGGAGGVAEYDRPVARGIPIAEGSLVAGVVTGRLRPLREEGIHRSGPNSQWMLRPALGWERGADRRGR